MHEGRPNPADLIVSGDVKLLINTPLGKLTQRDDYSIRRAALQHRVPYMTTMSAASAACDAVLALKSRTGGVRCLQEWYEIARAVNGERGTDRPAAQPPRGSGQREAGGVVPDRPAAVPPGAASGDRAATEHGA
jgi:hypothetical protein